MIKVEKLQRWLDRFNPDTFIGVDDGGLTLIHIEKDGVSPTGAYWEIGGLPEVAEEKFNTL